MIDVLKLQLLQQHAQTKLERQARMSRAWDAYLGRYPAPLKTRPGQPDDNVTPNFARPIVDLGVSFLFGKEIKFELTEGKTTEAEAWLDNVWRKNNKMSLLARAGIAGAVTGHCFIKIALPGPRLIVLDPALMDVRLAADDIDRVEAFIMEWSAYDGDDLTHRRQEIVADGGRWVIRDLAARPGREWETVAEAVWPYPFPPIVHCQNLPDPTDFWGEADLSEDVLTLIQSLHATLSNIQRILRYHAHPKVWGRGFQARNLNMAVDDVIVFPNTDAELRVLEMNSDLRAAREHYEALKKALHEITRIPEAAFGHVDSGGVLSGVALQIRFAPLLDKTEMKRRLYGDMLTELCRRLLIVGGFDDAEVLIHWPPALPTNDREAAETALILKQLGVSDWTLLQRLGFDPELEAARREYSAAEAGKKILEAFDAGHLAED